MRTRAAPRTPRVHAPLGPARRARGLAAGGARRPRARPRARRRRLSRFAPDSLELGAAHPGTGAPPDRGRVTYGTRREGERTALVHQAHAPSSVLAVSIGTDVLPDASRPDDASGSLHATYTQRSRERRAGCSTRGRPVREGSLAWWFVDPVRECGAPHHGPRLPVNSRLFRGADAGTRRANSSMPPCPLSSPATHASSGSRVK